MIHTHDSATFSPSHERRRKIAKRVETQILQQTDLKTSREVRDSVSKPSTYVPSTKQDQPINQSQPVTRSEPKYISGDQLEGQDQDNLLTEADNDDWDKIDQDSAKQKAQAYDAQIRKEGWAEGKEEEVFFRKKYRFDHESLFYKRNYYTPINSEVSRGPNSFWDTQNHIVVRRSTREIVELKKGESMDFRLRQFVRKKQREAAQADNFLQSNVRDLGSGWKGVKVLGKGGQGIVGLWEHNGPDHRHPWGKKVVVKLTLSESFKHERDMMLLLGNDNPRVSHAAKLLHPTFVDPQGRNYFIRRMVLEFCEGGDLYKLIVNQKKKRYHFPEQTLWYFFACLVKGLNIMDHGDESPGRKPDSRWPMCHFDLKPANVLVGKKDDGEHKEYPILKIADYGLAETIDPVNYMKFWRGRGTQGYLLPEQFSRRWAYANAATSGHVNVYGTHSNVWSVGVIMYMLATLSGPPRPKGFRCALIGKKFTYGYKLRARNLSNPLKRLIWRCLCDKPRERPSLEFLDVEIQSAMEVIEQKMKDYPLGLEPDEPQDPAKLEKENAKAKEEAKEKEKEKEKEREGGLSGDDPNQTVVKRNANEASNHAVQDAPIFIQHGIIRIPGKAGTLRNMLVTFCVVPKHVPLAQQWPIWFKANVDTTVQQLKSALRVQAGFGLADEEQFLYNRAAMKPGPNEPPDVLMSNPQAMLTSGYSVGQGTRLELWTSVAEHDLYEPDEGDFDIV